MTCNDGPPAGTKFGNKIGEYPILLRSPGPLDFSDRRRGERLCLCARGDGGVGRVIERKGDLRALGGKREPYELRRARADGGGVRDGGVRDEGGLRQQLMMRGKVGGGRRGGGGQVEREVVGVVDGERRVGVVRMGARHGGE